MIPLIYGNLFNGLLRASQDCSIIYEDINAFPGINYLFYCLFYLLSLTNIANKPQAFSAQFFNT